MPTPERHVCLFRHRRYQAPGISREFEAEVEEALISKESGRLILEPIRKGRLQALLTFRLPLTGPLAQRPNPPGSRYTRAGGLISAAIAVLAVAVVAGCQTRDGAPGDPSSITGRGQQSVFILEPIVAGSVEPAVEPEPVQEALTAEERNAAKRELIDQARTQSPESVDAGPELNLKKKSHSQASRPKFVEDRSNYDRSNPGFPYLQSPKEALSGFPLDTYGAVNWVEALEKGYINPRRGVNANDTMEHLDTQIVMTNTRDMPHVNFPHKQHTEWLACGNCHPKPFSEKKGANPINMDAIMRGEYCGLCHDRVAFSIISCERCHNILHKGAPTRWW